ncbi:JmjC domain-containing protein [Streptomyces hoynatensis]|uniref:JmjC domain-containing protein n=1 Tax=Streptomyces hoynatensis TaxID=1141874 RepID=A0A3A9Z6F8_9ACTN|nr:cupin domain-containing protein [Streptomyces hoynatensis]RKN43951.1 hypothetical protein D7294_09705 [Streptomyces hoynatensis]
MDCMLRLVEDIKILESAWERNPVLSTGLDDLRDVLSLESVDALLARGFPLPSVRLVVDGRPVPPVALAAPGRYGRSSTARVADGAKVARRVREGATLILEDLKSHLPQVAAFADSVSAATGYDTYCSAFLTPAGHPGVAPHHDTASVFVRQLSGAKHWRVSRPSRRWPLRESGPGVAEEGTVLEATLRVGDCLYLPRGFVHAATAQDAPSLHLSLALRPVTWAYVLRKALDLAAERREELREALPPAFAGVDAARLLPERGAAFAACLEELAASGGFAALAGALRPAAGTPGALLDAVNGQAAQANGPAKDAAKGRANGVVSGAGGPR